MSYCMFCKYPVDTYGCRTTCHKPAIVNSTHVSVGNILEKISEEEKNSLFGIYISGLEKRIIVLEEFNKKLIEELREKGL